MKSRDVEVKYVHESNDVEFAAKRVKKHIKKDMDSPDYKLKEGDISKEIEDASYNVRDAKSDEAVCRLDPLGELLLLNKVYDFVKNHSFFSEHRHSLFDNFTRGGLRADQEIFIHDLKEKYLELATLAFTDNYDESNILMLIGKELIEEKISQFDLLRKEIREEKITEEKREKKISQLNTLLEEIRKEIIDGKITQFDELHEEMKKEATDEKISQLYNFLEEMRQLIRAEKIKQFDKLRGEMREQIRSDMVSLPGSKLITQSTGVKNYQSSTTFKAIAKIRQGYQESKSVDTEDQDAKKGATGMEGHGEQVEGPRPRRWK